MFEMAMVPAEEPDEFETESLDPNPTGQGSAARILSFQTSANRSLRNVANPSAKSMVFRSEAMVQLIAKAKRFAKSSAAVLIAGESGTGKELLSRMIHVESSRSEQPYVTLNCAALPEMLIESELFGHTRGAFTGAFQQRTGHFQMAHRGTILLDEISEIPISIQAKLLRVIEEQEVQRIGRGSPEKIDVRIVATSNRELGQEVQRGVFRLDLFHRLSVLCLEIPPLRQRVDDIPLLAEYFLNQYRSEASETIHGFTPAAMKRLCEHDWPGNIRELRNVIHSACVECSSNRISTLNLPNPRVNTKIFPPAVQPLFNVERESILASIQRHHGNKTAAAAELGVTSRTLANKLKRYEAA